MRTFFLLISLALLSPVTGAQAQDAKTCQDIKCLNEQVQKLQATVDDLTKRAAAWDKLTTNAVIAGDTYFIRSPRITNFRCMEIDEPGGNNLSGQLCRPPTTGDTQQWQFLPFKP